MRYLEWNNIISEHFFNPANAGKEIYLYITKQEVANISRDFFTKESDDEIWKDFIEAIKYKEGIRKLCSPIEESLQLYCEWNKEDNPPFIAYLILFIIPLTEVYDCNFSSTNYYGRINLFLHNNEVLSGFNEIGTSNFHKISHLWNSLEEWSIITKNCDLGIFELKKFGNPNWIYVGKPLSQCVLPPRAIKKLPELFLESGMIPDSFYPPAEIKKKLLHFGPSILGLSNSVLELIKKSESNELGQSIIEIVKREYRKWSGESHSFAENESVDRAKRNYILSRIYLQFKLNTIEGKINYSFRIKSSIEFPEDLKLRDIEITNERKGFSRTLNLPFKETFELKDEFNKWIAKFPSQDVHLLISAASFQLSSDYWLETDTLSKTDWMYLFCKNELRDSIIDWGKNHCTRFEDESDLENIPDGYSLFKLLGPKESHKNIWLLTIYTEKIIQLVDGFDVNFRTFTDDYLPEVEIINSDGTEKVFLQYKNSTEKLFLKKERSNSNHWILPDLILRNTDFNIRIDGEVLSGNETTYKIVSANGSALQITGVELPKRDAFGRITDKTLKEYSVGSNTVGTSLLRHIPYQPLFRGRTEDTCSETIIPKYDHHKGNVLLSFLTLKNISTGEDFYKAFEFLHSKYFEINQQGDNFNYTKIKKASLNFFDYLGYLDYEYETKKIVVNPPQLIFIPANKGRKVLLIGGRDASLIESIIQFAPEFHLQVEITKQFPSNENLLLPDAITIKAFGSPVENFGENNLKAFAKKLKIKLDPCDLIQVGLQQFSADIDEYEKELLKNNETNQNNYDWARRIFDVNTLTFEKDTSETYDKSFSLIEYKLNEYTFYHRLWKNEKCYSINMNWGRYLALKFHEKQVILYDAQKGKVAISTRLPLPRLLAESVMLLSGLAPVYSIIDSKPYRIYENIPSIFIQNLFSKLKQKTIDYNL